MKAAIAFKLFCLPVAVWADDIDRAFKAQNAPSEVRASVDASVQNQAALARQKVIERALDIERQRAAEMEQYRSSASSSSTAPSGKSGVALQSPPSISNGTSKGSGSFAFLCQYKCTNAKFVFEDRTALTFRVNAPDINAAIDETIRHAKSTCYQQTQRVYDVGSQSCRKQ